MSDEQSRGERPDKPKVVYGEVPSDREEYKEYWISPPPRTSERNRRYLEQAMRGEHPLPFRIADAQGAPVGVSGDWREELPDPDLYCFASAWMRERGWEGVGDWWWRPDGTGPVSFREAARATGAPILYAARLAGATARRFAEDVRRALQAGAPAMRWFAASPEVQRALPGAPARP